MSSLAKSDLKKATISAIIGNSLEWYDYAIYSSCASVIADLFFPNSNKTIAMIQVFAIFAVGFLARPLGAAIFSYIADVHGRRKSLSIAILMMAFPTAIIGLLPPYSQIGALSTIILVLVRILQGISLGGEFSTSAIYLIECSPKEKKPFYGSLAMVSIAIGICVGNVFILALNHFLTKEQFYSFGWRIPFLISIFFGFFGFYIRKKIDESPDFIEAKKLSNPLQEVISNHKKSTVKAFFIAMSDGIPFYVFCVYSKSFMESQLNYNLNISTLFNICIMAFYAVGALFSGHFTYKLGKTFFMRLSLILTAITTFPFFNVIQHHNYLISASFICLMGFIIGLYHGPLPFFLSSLFPANIRGTGLSISYNTSLVIFGGTAPIFCAFLIHKFGSINFISIYILTSCFLSFVFLFNKSIDK